MRYSVVSNLGRWILFEEKNGERVYSIGSLEKDKYLVVPESQCDLVWEILQRLRQGQSDEEIEQALLTNGIKARVADFCHLLAAKGLIIPQDPAQQPLVKAQKHWFTRLRSEFLALSWEIWKFEFQTRHTAPLHKFSRHYLALLIGAVMLSSMVLLTISPFMSLNPFEGVVFSMGVRGLTTEWWMLLLINVLLFPLSTFLHELSHALAAAQYGLSPKRLTLRLYLLGFLFLSIQLPGLYTLPMRRRVSVMAAGPLMNLLLGNLFTLLAAGIGFQASMPWFNAALSYFIILNYGRVVRNLLPFLPTDGYYLLSQLVFKEVDIRSKAFIEFTRWWHGKKHSFTLKYAIYLFVNVSILLCLLTILLSWINQSAWEWLRAHTNLPSLLIYSGLALLDMVVVYLYYRKIKAFFRVESPAA